MEIKDKVSVAMATYNGERFIKKQIDSILVNLKDNDELIISDDGSNDNTIAIIEEYKDERIKLIKGPRKGVIKNFENAIKYANGDIIFLADQDDIWVENKVKKILNVFEGNEEVTLVIHDNKVFDSETNKILIESFFKYRKSGSGIIKNIIKNTYIGCCIAFKKELKPYLENIPIDIEMHDQWIGVINEKKCGKSYFLPECLLFYRRHQNNVSSMKRYPIMQIIRKRYKFIKNYLDYIYKSK